MIGRHCSPLSTRVCKIAGFVCAGDGRGVSEDSEVLIWFGELPVDSERVAIAILFTGILFLLTIVLHSWRQDIKKRRRIRRLKNAERDLPPSYNQVVDRKSPPEYKESLMQV